MNLRVFIHRKTESGIHTVNFRARSGTKHVPGIATAKQNNVAKRSFTASDENFQLCAAHECIADKPGGRDNKGQIAK